jgi:hypothetical protein
MPAPRKKKTKSVAIHNVATYAHLGRFVEGFINGHFPLMILIGGPGVGKSEMFRGALADMERCWIEGNVTAFGMYERLYNHRDQTVVIDDVDCLCSTPASINLLKSLCQTVEEKLVSWSSRRRYLENHGLPAEFKTTSKVIVITNNWRTLNRNVTALEDRGIVIRFEPSAEEVHTQAGKWFKDAEIYGWFGMNLSRVVTPTFRNYIRAAQLKAAGMDWTTVLAGVPKANREALALELIRDQSFTSTNDRAKAFVEKGGGSRSTFFNYRRKLE